MSLQSFLVNFSQLADAPNAIPRLRELILQLAVEGKLVHQDDREESASRLVERIEAEKVRLAKETGLKVSQIIPVREEEFPYVLPDGWLWSRLMNLGLINPRNNFDDNETVSFVPMNLIPQKYGESVKTETRYWGDIKKGFTHFAESDVVLAKITPCFQNGKAVVMRGLENEVGAGTTELHVFRPINGFIYPDYVLAYLKSPKFLQGGIPRMTGTAGQKRVPNDYFAQNPFPLPPLAEQRRIVAKVDELMRLCDELEARQQAKRESRMRLNTAITVPLNKAGSLTPEEFEQATARLADNFDTLYDSIDTISNLRATILQLAVQGKLVAQEPNENRIQTIVDSDSRSFTSYDLRLFSELRKTVTSPSRWLIEPLARIASAVVDCPHSTPKWTTQGEICVRTTQFRPGHLDLDDVRFVSEATYLSRIQRLEPAADDILYSREGGILGVACRVPPDTKLCLGQRMMLIRASKIVEPAFLELVMNSPFITQIAKERTTGGAAPRINVATVKSYPIPVPPLEEQKRIVTKVNQLMSLCDELEAKLRQAEVDSEKLMNAAVKHVLDSVRDASKTAEEVFT